MTPSLQKPTELPNRVFVIAANPGHAREQMSKYIGIDDIRYFREFKEGKTLNEIGFEFRNMSFPIVSCWLSVFFPEKIYPVSRTSFADVVRKLFNAKAQYPCKRLPFTGNELLPIVCVLIKVLYPTKLVNLPS